MTSHVSLEPAGFLLRVWCNAANISRSLYYTLPPEDRPSSVKFRRRRIITEPPAQWLKRISSAQKKQPA